MTERSVPYSSHTEALYGAKALTRVVFLKPGDFTCLRMAQYTTCSASSTLPVLGGGGVHSAAAREKLPGLAALLDPPPSPPPPNALLSMDFMEPMRDVGGGKIELGCALSPGDSPA